jgi:hypothetical protein
LILWRSIATFPALPIRFIRNSDAADNHDMEYQFGAVAH